jgi:hypothetical protein
MVFTKKIKQLGEQFNLPQREAKGMITFLKIFQFFETHFDVQLQLSLRDYLKSIKLTYDLFYE